MDLFNKLNESLQPKSQKLAQKQVMEQAQTAIESAYEDTSSQRQTHETIKGANQTTETPLMSSNFDNIDLGVRAIDPLYVSNMTQLSRNEVDVVIDPSMLMAQSQHMYPADLVSFKPLVLNLGDGGCTETISEVNFRKVISDIDFNREQPYTKDAPYRPLAGMIGAVVKVHTSDLFSGQNKVVVATGQLTAEFMLKDRNTEGIIAMLPLIPRYNVNIEALLDGSVSQKYTERAGAAEVAFVNSDFRMSVQAINAWAEIYTILGTSAIRKLLYEAVACGEVDKLAYKLAKFVG